jgi:hypothetical protein
MKTNNNIVKYIDDLKSLVPLDLSILIDQLMTNYIIQEAKRENENYIDNFPNIKLFYSTKIRELISEIYLEQSKFTSTHILIENEKIKIYDFEIKIDALRFLIKSKLNDLITEICTETNLIFEFRKSNFQIKFENQRYNFKHEKLVEILIEFMRKGLIISGISTTSKKNELSKIQVDCEKLYENIFRIDQADYSCSALILNGIWRNYVVSDLIDLRKAELEKHYLVYDLVDQSLLEKIHDGPIFNTDQVKMILFEKNNLKIILNFFDLVILINLKNYQLIDDPINQVINSEIPILKNDYVISNIPLNQIQLYGGSYLNLTEILSRKLESDFIHNSF